MSISRQAASAREGARQGNGQFGEQSRADPGQLGLDSAGPAMPRSFTFEGDTFHRSDGSTRPGEPYRMAFVADRPISDEEMARMGQLVGYVWAAKVRGEAVGDPVRVDERSFVVPADSTKSRRDDLGQALGEFEQSLPATLREGSPVRSTNRAGAGTAGTRLVEGVGPVSVGVYYDDALTGTAGRAGEVAEARREFEEASGVLAAARRNRADAGARLVAAQLGPEAHTVLVRRRPDGVQSMAVLGGDGERADLHMLPWQIDEALGPVEDVDALAEAGRAEEMVGGWWRIRLR